MSALNRHLDDDIAAAERWLATHDTPSPSSADIERIKQAARDELTRLRPSGTGRRWAAWHGALAAAAAIALSVTVAWLSMGTRAAGTALVTDVGGWPRATEQEATTLASLDEGLSDLEAWSDDEAWNLSGVALYEAIEEVLEDPSSGAVDESGASIRWPRRRGESEDA